MRSVPGRSCPGWSSGSPKAPPACPLGRPPTWRRSRRHRAKSRREEILMFDLTGRKALVTGATGGIGGAIARALHQQGATVAISGTRRAALDELASGLGERVAIVEADLANKDAVEALVPAAEAAMGGLDIL